MLVKSLPPVIDAGARFLILGAAPDETSYQRKHYYADKYNVFWHVLAIAANNELPVGYIEQTAFLKRKGIALWYVLAECEREGDVDSSIRDEVPNDFAWLFASYPSVKTVLFNGKNARRLYKKHFGLPPGRRWLPASFDCATMPSTSATPVMPMRYVKPCAERLERGRLCLDRFIFQRIAEYERSVAPASGD